jgi:hypothetical protein
MVGDAGLPPEQRVTKSNMAFEKGKRTLKGFQGFASEDALHRRADGPRVRGLSVKASVVQKRRETCDLTLSFPTRKKGVLYDVYRDWRTA